VFDSACDRKLCSIADTAGHSRCRLWWLDTNSIYYTRCII